MTERDRLLRRKQDGDALWEQQNTRLLRLQQALSRETRVEEQDRLESIILDSRRRLQETEAEQRAIEAQLAQLNGDAVSSTNTGSRAPDFPVPSRAGLRRLLEELFPTDVELESFCVDYCAEVQSRFTIGMERGQKHNLLLLHLSERELLNRLFQHSPDVQRLLLATLEVPDEHAAPSDKVHKKA